MPAVTRPKTKRLHNKDPRIVANYCNKYEALAEKYKLEERSKKLDEGSTHPLTAAQQYEYETLDAIPEVAKRTDCLLPGTTNS